MDRYTIKAGKRLRLGYTTGTCAAAATKAAALMLLTGGDICAAEITTPSGATLFLDIEDVRRTPDSVSCAVTKDAGDDPDVTDGIKVYSTVRQRGTGVAVEGGEGVGRVTRPGLRLPVGSAAINPVPRKMIEYELSKILSEYPGTAGLEAVISVPQGVDVAKKTFNPRLGIEGGISILGTTGVVEPMSEKAVTDTIRLEMEMKYRRGVRAVLLIPGNYGVDYIRTRWGLGPDIGVKVSNFIGEALDFAVYLGFESILLAGHSGKLIKLAAGVMNTHSRVADGRMEILAAHAALSGAERPLIREIMDSVTTDAALALLERAGLLDRVMETISARISQSLGHRTQGRAAVAFTVFGSDGRMLCSSESGQLDFVLRQIKAGECT